MLEKYKTILVAIDGSEQSELALKEAAAIAKRNDSKLNILTVSDEMLFASDPQAASFVMDQSDFSAKIILENAEKTVPDEIDYETFSQTGNSKALIVNFAKESRADLLVVGATGKGAIERVLVGSTTAYLVNNSPCSVLVVK